MVVVVVLWREVVWERECVGFDRQGRGIEVGGGLVGIEY